MTSFNTCIDKELGRLHAALHCAPFQFVFNSVAQDSSIQVELSACWCQVFGIYAKAQVQHPAHETEHLVTLPDGERCPILQIRWSITSDYQGELAQVGCWPA